MFEDLLWAIGAAFVGVVLGVAISLASGDSSLEVTGNHGDDTPREVIFSTVGE